MGTQWYILFNVIAGASCIPNDMKEAARTFKMKGWDKWKKLIIPAIFPFWVTGACTAAGGAWNASVVAEVATWKDQTLTAEGLGAFINHVTTMGDEHHDRLALILCSTGVMSIMVLTLNKFIWRRLYDLAERRFRLD
jgi:NitT/TauT family transport system permease protein